ncbi:MAG: sugar phosphate isomerase/epimerase, partial [Candidatus Brockarchaeota archaeon]|nr:sugar phosphate isomerase/epimerase [Candidatus Brockarchaeota archaeon]
APRRQLNNQILMHTWPFRTYSAESALTAAASLGYDGIELWTGGHYGVEGLVEKKEPISDALKKFGVPMVAVTFGSPATSKKVEERKAGLSKFRSLIGVLKDLGVSVVNTSPGPPQSKNAGEDDYKLASEYFSEAGDYLKDEGLTLALEIHMGVLTDTAASTAKLLKLVGSRKVVANWDPGNMYATEGAEAPSEAFQILKGFIGYMHVKNCKKIGGEYVWSASVEDGDLDFNKIFSMLRSIDYGGAFCVEYSGLGDPNVVASRDIKYVRGLLKGS